MMWPIRHDKMNINTKCRQLNHVFDIKSRQVGHFDKQVCLRHGLKMIRNDVT